MKNMRNGWIILLFEAFLILFMASAIGWLPAVIPTILMVAIGGILALLGGKILS